MKRLLLTALAASAMAASAGASRADDGFYLTLTQKADGLHIASNLPTNGGFDPNGFAPNSIPEPNEQQYFFGPTYGGYDLFSVYDGDPNAGFHIGAVSWIDPTHPSLYNVLLFLPSGNRGNEDFDLVTNVPNLSDVPLVYDSQDVNGHTCYFPGAYEPCPVLNNGGTRDMSIFVPDYPNGDNTYSTLHVTYTDQADGAPEPASWALMIAGFGLAGAALRNRRRAVA